MIAKILLGSCLLLAFAFAAKDIGAEELAKFNFQDPLKGPKELLKKLIFQSNVRENSTWSLRNLLQTGKKTQKEWLDSIENVINEHSTVGSQDVSQILKDTALRYASEMKDAPSLSISLAKKLIEIGANVNDLYSTKTTVLCSAICFHNHQLLEYYLSLCNVDDGTLALEDRTLALALMNAMRDIDKLRYFDTIWEHLSEAGKLNIIGKFDEEFSFYVMAASTGNEHCIKKLFEHTKSNADDGAKISQEHKILGNACHAAAIKKKWRVLALVASQAPGLMFVEHHQWKNTPIDLIMKEPDAIKELRSVGDQLSAEVLVDDQASPEVCSRNELWTQVLDSLESV